MSNAALVEYLRSPEAAARPDAEIARDFEVKTRAVKKARQMIADEGPEAAADQDDAIEQLSRELPEDEDSFPTDDDSAGSPEEDNVLAHEVGHFLPPDPASPPMPYIPEPPAVPVHDDPGGGIVLPGEKIMRLRSIDLDSGTRVRELNNADAEEAVRNMALVMEQQGSTAGFGDLTVFWIPDLRRTVLTDGFTRHEAASRALGDDATFRVVLHVGTLADAIEDAFKHNRTHGRQFTREERRRIVHRILADGRWGNPGVKRIMELTGENDKDLVRKAKEDWFKAQGQEPPGTITVTRGGTTYEQVAKQNKRPRPQPDAAEGDTFDSGPAPMEGGDQKQFRIDREYLQAIPVRAQLSDDVLPTFDRAAIARRDGQRVHANARNWLLRFRDGQGVPPDSVLPPDHPLVVFYEKVANLPMPLDEHGKPTWTACRKCHSEGKSTGWLPDGNRCPACKGTGTRIPGL